MYPCSAELRIHLRAAARSFGSSRPSSYNSANKCSTVGWPDCASDSSFRRSLCVSASRRAVVARRSWVEAGIGSCAVPACTKRKRTAMIGSTLCKFGKPSQQNKVLHQAREGYCNQIALKTTFDERHGDFSISAMWRVA